MSDCSITGCDDAAVVPDAYGGTCLLHAGPEALRAALRVEYVVCRAAGYPDPHSPYPNTRENAERFAAEHRRPGMFPAVIKTRLVSDWEKA